jgi:3-deoxy-D-manno-octulosonate 8-phosphate phosphatase (KDO 8-P phosphatase)
MAAASPSLALTEKAARVRLLLFDVDGVMTDGTVLLHADGSESKAFHIRDGTGIVWAHRAGLLTGLLSARASRATAQRAAQLAIRIVAQGVGDKLEGYERIIRERGLADGEVAYMGDDLLDLPVLARVGLSAAPADAVPDVRDRVDWVSAARGGHGAVREMVELVLKTQARWGTITAAYLGDGAPPGP